MQRRMYNYFNVESLKGKEKEKQTDSKLFMFRWKGSLLD